MKEVIALVDREKLHQKYGDERIRIVDAEYANAVLCGAKGFIPLDEEVAIGVIGELRQQESCLERYLSEYRPEFRQLVVYCVLMDEYGRIFATKRINNAGESRLNNQFSIGTGGHVSESDLSIEDAVRRELNEELNIDYFKVAEYIGVIHDFTSSVELDHLGVVVKVTTISARSTVTVKETEKLKGRWYTKRELAENINKMEHWSKLVLQHIC